MSMSPMLYTIVRKGQYPAYAEEVEALRQTRMADRLEWRRQMRRKMALNRLVMIAYWYGLTVCAIVGIVLLGELLRLTVWTVLR